MQILTQISTEFKSAIEEAGFKFHLSWSVPQLILTDNKLKCEIILLIFIADKLCLLFIY